MTAGQPRLFATPQEQLTSDELPARIAAKMETDPTTGCWRWTAALTGPGYGEVRWLGRVRGAHRVVWELLIGPVPDGLELDHLCRNRACVNPGHLEPVTRRENVRRGDKCNRSHCPQGHEYTPENTRMNPQGTRCCRECNRIRCRERYAARKGEA